MKIAGTEIAAGFGTLQLARSMHELDPWTASSYTVVPGLRTLVPALPASWAGGVVDDSPEAVSVVRCYFVVQTTLTSDDAALASIYVLAF